MPSKSKDKEKKSKHVFRLSLPATSANLGPAFDAAALAMVLFVLVLALTLVQRRLLERRVFYG